MNQANTEFTRFFFNRTLLKIAILILTLLLIGCQSNAKAVTPVHPLYVVAMNAETAFGKRNELIVLDADTLEITNRTRLMDDSLFFKFSRDPIGRIWIGYAGTLENATKRVDIFEPNGVLLKSMDVCGWPNVEIVFADGKAFVPCYLNGFHAEVAAIDLLSLEMIKKIELTEQPRFTLLASVANSTTVLTIGSSDTHATMFFIDPQTQEIINSVPLYGGADIHTIIVHDNKFYLLNRSSSLVANPPIDLRIVEVGEPPKITECQLGDRDPWYGAIQGDSLWTYHKRAISEEGSISISQLNLRTGESKNWPLHDYWWAGDMILLNGKIVLTRRYSSDPSETDGLYEFNPETGKLTQILELPGAHLLLAPKSN